MAGRRSPVTDIREILRRLHLGEPDRRIARDLGISRNTVAHYRVWAARHGVLDGGALPDVATLAELLAPAPSERPAHPDNDRAEAGPGVEPGVEQSCGRCLTTDVSSSRHGN